MSEVISLIEDYILKSGEAWTRPEMQKEFPVTRITLRKKSLVYLFMIVCELFDHPVAELQRPTCSVY